MPVDRRGPNINERRLGLYLRRLREALELSYGEAAVQLGCNVDWLVRLETGFEPVTPDQVRDLLDGYRVPPHRIRALLIDLAARRAGPPWLAEHIGRLKTSARDVIILESESWLVRSWSIHVIPALARTEAYARMCFADAIPEVDPDREWALLDSRQRHRPGGLPRTLHLLLDESALLPREPDPQVMFDQLEHLNELSDSGRATVRVVPFSAGAHAGLSGAFDVLEFRDTDERVSVVYDALGIDLAPDLADTWRLIEEVALSPADTREIIAEVRAGEPPPGFR